MKEKLVFNLKTGPVPDNTNYSFPELKEEILQKLRDKFDTMTPEVFVSHIQCITEWDINPKMVAVEG